MTIPKFIRMAAAVLVMLALALPVASPPEPASAHLRDVVARPADGTGGAPVAPFPVDPSTGLTVGPCEVLPEGQAKYWISLVNNLGQDVTNATVRLVPVANVPPAPINPNAPVTLTAGNWERVSPGSGAPVPTGCINQEEIPGHFNDYTNLAPVPSNFNNRWNMLITAPGHDPLFIDLVALGFFDGGTPACVNPTAGSPFPGADGVGCLFSLGTIGNVAPLVLTATPLVGNQIQGSVTGINNLPLNGADVVLVSPVTGAVVARTRTGVAPFGGTGFFRFVNIPAGTYQLNIADNVNDYTLGSPGMACGVAGGACGHLIFSAPVTVSATGTTEQNVQLTAKPTPAAPVAGAVNIFGEVRNGRDGGLIQSQGVTITVTQGTTFATRTTPAGMAPGANQTTVNQQGRFAVTGIPAPGAGVFTFVELGPVQVIQCLNPPLAGDFPGAPRPECVDAIPSATALAGLGAWIDPSFIVSALGPLQTVGDQRLETTLPFVMRNPDTTRTGGVEIQTTQVRIANTGAQRTGARIEWIVTNADGTSARVDADLLDLNPGAVAIFGAAVIPDGFIGMAEVYSIDLDGIGGPIYGLGDLHAVTHQNVRLPNRQDGKVAVDGTNGITLEDLLFVPQPILGGAGFAALNAAYVLPTVFKNYGGGVYKWSSVLNACLTTGVPAPQPVVIQFQATGPIRGGPWQLSRTAFPGGCITINVGTEPELASLPNGPFAVRVTSTGGFPFTTGIIGGGQAPFSPDVARPSGMFASSVSFTVNPDTGGTAAIPAAPNVFAVAQNGYSSPAGEMNFRTLYGALVFKRFNDWNTGITVANWPVVGTSGSASVSIAVYDEGGQLMGTVQDQLSAEVARVYYLPDLPFPLPDGFRGSVVVSGGATSSAQAGRLFVFANHVNYERGHAISYNFTRAEALTAPDTVGTAPCRGQTAAAAGGFPGIIDQILVPNIPVFTCLWGADVVKTTDGRGNPSGPTTGIRLFNPGLDPAIPIPGQVALPGGVPAQVVIQYVDPSGIVYTDATTFFAIPAFGTATIFLGTDQRLPSLWNGSVRVLSNVPILGVANVVDYGMMGVDGSRAYNLPNNAGLTQ